MTISNSNIDVRILLAGRWDGHLSDMVAAIHREPRFEVIGPCETDSSTLQQVHILCPQLVLIDMVSFEEDPFQTAEKIISISYNCRVLFLGDNPTDDQIGKILAIKAHGLVCETERPVAVLAAIREVASGGMYFSEAIRSRLVIDSEGIRLDPAVGQDG